MSKTKNLIRVPLLHRMRCAAFLLFLRVMGYEDLARNNTKPGTREITKNV